MDGRELGQLFRPDNPLFQLVRQYEAHLAANPHAVIELLTDPALQPTDPLVAFIRTEKSETKLVPVTLGEDKYVGIVLAAEKGEPISLSDGNKLMVLPVSGVIELLQPKSEVISQESALPVAVESPQLSLPAEIQEINGAFSTQSPKLGRLEARPSDLSDQLYTIHQQDNPTNGLTAVSMYNVEKYTTSVRGKSKGKVSKSRSTRHVVGFYLPTEGEMKDAKKLVDNITKLKRRLARRKHAQGASAGFEMEAAIDISVVTPNQLEIWREANYFTELKAYQKDAASLERVFTLFSEQLGDDVQIQVQHITNGKADLVFVPVDARLPSDLSAFDIVVGDSPKRRGISEDEDMDLDEEAGEDGPAREVVERVVGLMCVPDGMSKAEKKYMAKNVSRSLRLLYTGKSLEGKTPNILPVDNELLTYWQQKIIESEQIVVPHVGKHLENLLSHSEHGVVVGKDDVCSVEFFTHEPHKPGIGAKFMQIVIRYGDLHVERITLDHGTDFDDPRLRGLTKPSFAKGMAVWKNLPQDQEKLWRRTLLLREAQAKGARFFDPSNPYARDLAMRVGLPQFVYLAEELGYPNAQEAIPTLFGGLPPSNVHQIAAIYSHAHADHIGMGGLLSTNIPVITTDESIPFFETLFLTAGGGYAAEAIFRRERKTLLTLKSNRIYTPPLFLPEPYQEIRIGRGQVGITLLPASHSIYGGTMVKVTIYDRSDKVLKNIVYTGDFNFDDRSMMAETEAYLQDVDSIIVDTTNIRPNAYGKPSVGVTRDMMREAFREVLTRSDKSTIVELAWNNPRDFALIQGIAAELGKNVYVYPKMALLLYLLHELDETRQKTEQSYNWRAHDPVPRLGEEMGILPWQYPKMTGRRGEHMLEEMMDVATHASLASAPPHVLFVPPNPMLEDTMEHANLPNYGEVIRAHYWPYGPNDKYIYRENSKFTRANNLTYFSDLRLEGSNIKSSFRPTYHMSGHARPEDTLALLKRMADSGALRQVIPIHGDARQDAARRIRAQNDQLIVYDRFEKNGYTIPIYTKD